MNNVQKTLIVDALINVEHLSEWEANFLTHLSEFDPEAPLSIGQNHKLNDITTKLNEIEQL